ncbi:hypothetical protein HN011_008608 [Eciton burchellii]|nr:hypothetical protein HN011_008608 [Eciton burchellii]
MGSKAVNYPTKCGIARCFISQTLLKEHQRESASCSPGHNSAQCVSRDLFPSEKTKRLHATAQGASQTAAKFQSWSLVFVNPKRSPKRSKVTRKAANDVLSGRYPNLQLGRDERTNSSANTRTPLRYGKACNSADVYSWITFLVCAAFVDGLLTTQFVILLSFQSIPVNRLVKDFSSCQKPDRCRSTRLAGRRTRAHRVPIPDLSWMLKDRKDRNATQQPSWETSDRDFPARQTPTL